MKPIVSIIIPTYNRALMLRRAIDSVLAQTYKDWELIIIDDGSIDNTVDVLRLYLKDGRIIYKKQENKGIGAARNVGIDLSSGAYIAFLDSDDTWDKEKISKQVSFLESHEEFQYCFTADNIVYENGRHVIKHFDHIKNIKWYRLAGRGVSVPSSHIYRKKDFMEIGSFDENYNLIGLEDNEWSVRGFDLNGKYIDEALTYYYVHSTQTTKENIEQKITKQIRGLTYILKKNFKILKQKPLALLYRCMQLFYLKIRHGIRL